MTETSGFGSGTRSAGVAALLLGVYALSGAAALLYQVVWQRWLVFTVGLSTVSVSLIVSAFLAGLGAGYLGGGWLADRLAPRRALLVFGALEIGIALSALASEPVLYGWLPTVSQLGADHPWRTFVVVLVVLLPPTMLMGASLPVLSRAVALPTALAQAGFIGRLYFANTLGGGAAALLTALVVVPLAGFDGAVRLGAAANLLCAAGGVLLAWRHPGTAPAVHRAPADADGPVKSLAWAGWLTHAFVAGATGIAWEVLAFRLIENVAKSRAQTFAIILSVFLTGLAFGGLAGDLVRDRLGARRRAVFLGSQTLLYALCGLGPALLVAVLGSVELGGAWRASLAEYEPSTSPLVLSLNYGLLPAVLLLLPAGLMGFGFSVSQQLIQTSLSRVGRRLGLVQFVNVAGCVAGGMLTSLVAIPAVGTGGALAIVTAIGGGYALLWCVEASQRRWPLAALAAMAAVVVAVPSTDALWTALSGVSASRVLFREDASGVSSIRFDAGFRQQARVFANGLGQSALPRASDLVHVKLGAIPAFVHPAPARVGIIGLGSGGTAWAAGARPETRELVVWELMESQGDLLASYAARTGDRTGDWFLRDPRVSLRARDGRHALLTSRASFDVIEADALRPTSGYSGNLNSVEFFTLVRSRLASGGIAAAWTSTPRVLETFRRVFPHVRVVDGFVALGSDAPIAIDWAAIRLRAGDASVRSHFAAAGLDAERLLAEVFDGKPSSAFDAPPGPAAPDVNTDMRPRDELRAPFTLPGGPPRR